MAVAADDLAPGRLGSQASEANPVSSEPAHVACLSGDVVEFEHCELAGSAVRTGSATEQVAKPEHVAALPLCEAVEEAWVGSPGAAAAGGSNPMAVDADDFTPCDLRFDTRR